MDYQVLLLPKKNYWDWVRASREFVLEYGLNITNDPTTAGRYMAPAQVVTFPIVKDGFGEAGDIERWLVNNHDGVRLDPVAASTPAELKDEFGRRIAEQDRYGQKRKSFYLLWPTNYTVITQRFGANPKIYSKWDLPGHEGLDFRALTNTNIYACAEGEVYLVHTNPRTHPYGLHVRVRHKDGYKTVYGHLARVFVSRGQWVNAGDVIALADSSGASVGAHLHLTLKRDGATRRKETNYPKDIVDPSDLMVWPQRSSKSIDFSWAPGKCLIGAHGRIGGTLEDADFDAAAAGRLEAILIRQHEPTENIHKLFRLNPSMFIVCRLTSDFSQRQVAAPAFVEQVQADMGRLYRLGIRYFEVHTKPNLQNEGWKRSWEDGRAFGDWFLEVVERLRELYPEASLGFPGLSPGNSISGWRQDWRNFAAGAETAISRSDWIGVNCEWADSAEMNSISGGKLYEEVHLRFPDKMLMVTEFSNPSPDTGAEARAREYSDFYRTIRNEAFVGAAFSFALSSNDGYASLVWQNAEGNAVASLIGKRFY
jgi:murein DD-endopeptidase MepM/ murein hydrolase activator NlpD